MDFKQHTAGQSAPIRIPNNHNHNHKSNNNQHPDNSSTAITDEQDFYAPQSKPTRPQTAISKAHGAKGAMMQSSPTTHRPSTADSAVEMAAQEKATSNRAVSAPKVRHLSPSPSPSAQPATHPSSHVKGGVDGSNGFGQDDMKRAHSPAPAKGTPSMAIPPKQRGALQVCATVHHHHYRPPSHRPAHHTLLSLLALSPRPSLLPINSNPTDDYV